MKVTTLVASLLVAFSSVNALATPSEGVLLGRHVSANDIRAAALEARNNGGPQPAVPAPAAPQKSKPPKKQKCGLCGYGPRYAVGYWAAILAPNKCAMKCQRDWKCTTYSLQRKRDDKWVCKLYKQYKNMTIINDVTNPDGRAQTKWFVKNCPRPRIDPNNPEHLTW